MAVNRPQNPYSPVFTALNLSCFAVRGPDRLPGKVSRKEYSRRHCVTLAKPGVRVSRPHGTTNDVENVVEQSQDVLVTFALTVRV